MFSALFLPVKFPSFRKFNHMKKAIALIACMAVISLSSPAQQNLLSHGALKVSPNNRYLVHEDGTPFFWLGDTGWELFHRLNKDSADMYLKKRASQGFTVIQAVILAEMDGLHAPNAYGETPLLNDDPTKPNEKYFEFVDWVLDKAASYGLYIGLLPTWADKLFKDRWGTGPEIFTVDNAKIYGRWLGERYKNKKNIVWVLGGDRLPRNETDENVWRSMAAGITEGVGGKDKALMTYHPQPGKTCSSSPWFHKDGWLDFNMQQTGHCRDTKVWEFIGADYQLQPAKPTLNAEAIYEDHPVCFNARENGYSDAYDGRKAAWLSVFAGSLGYTYGCHSIWQFWTPGRVEVNRPLRYWYVSLDLPEANQMKHLRNLLEKFPAASRVPDQSVLQDTLTGTQRIQAIRGNDYLLVYSAGGETIRLTKTVSTTGSQQAFWYDPRTGARFFIGTISGTKTNSFVPPSKGYDSDWVLVLFSSNQKYLVK